ncbi:MAG: amidohydrolase family protein [Chitinophagales bacterium]|nr:amidohydrolase family protein [Chitinophagales bacterium]
MFYNCHTHIFNAKSVPEDFLGHGLIRLLSKSKFSFYLVFYWKRASHWVVVNLQKIPVVSTVMHSDSYVLEKVSGWLRRSVFTRWLARIFEWFADTPKDFVAKYAYLIEAGREKSQELIFEKLRKIPCYSEDTRFVVLTLNMDHMAAGMPRINYLTQLSFITRLKKKYPQHLLPFLCIDPRSGDEKQLLSFARHYIEDLGYIGIKFYPALGFYPFDPRLKLLYEYAQEKEIPIMTHCTKGGVFYKGELTADHLHPRDLDNKFIDTVFIDTSQLRNRVFKNNFSNPDNYRLVLERFPELKICMAHYGGSDQIMDYLRTKNEKSWYYKIKRMLVEYRNVYTDVSYTLFETHVFKLLKEDILSDEVGDKILFGTDYYMTEQEKNEKDLVSDFRKVLNESLFMKIALRNPEKYLKSAFYYPP